MSTREEGLLELESIGGLTAQEQADINDLRGFGAFPPALALEESAAFTPQALPAERMGKDLITRLGEELPSGVRTAADVAAGTFGAAAGVKIGAGLGAPFGPAGIAIGGTLGGVAAAGLATAAGREVTDIVFGDQSGTLGEELAEAGANVLEGAALEAGGLTGTKILTEAGKLLFGASPKSLFGFGKTAKEKIVNTIARLRSAETLDVPVTLAEGTGSQTMTALEGFFRKLVSAKGNFERYDTERLYKLLNAKFNLTNDVTKGITRKESAEALGISIQNEINTLLAGKVSAKGKVLDKIRNEVLEVFGSAESFEQLGRTTQELIESRHREIEGVASDFFIKAADTLPKKGATIVNTKNIVKAIDSAIKEESKALSTVGQKNIAVLNSIKNDFVSKVDIPESQVLDAAGRPFRPAVSKTVPTQTNFETVIRRRSDLNEIIFGKETVIGLPDGQQVVLKGKKTSRLFKGIKKALDVDLLDLSNKTGGRADPLLKSAIKTSKEGFDFVGSPSIKRLIRAEPETIADLVMRPNRTALAKTLRKELGPARMKPVEKAVTNKLLGVGIDEAPSGMKLRANIKKVGEATLRNLLPEDSFLALKELENRLIAQERIIARFRTSGRFAKEVFPEEKLARETTNNKFYRDLVSTKRPQDILDLISQPGNTRNVKRTYAALSEMGQADKIQDIKAAKIESLFDADPDTGFIKPESFMNNYNKLDDATQRAFFSPEERRGINDISNVLRLVSTRTGGLPEVIRVIAEPIGKPFSWLYLLKDGRDLLKKAIKEEAMLRTRPFAAKIGARAAPLQSLKSQLNATKRRIATFAINAQAKSDIRALKDKEGNETITPQQKPNLPALEGFRGL